MVLDRPIAKEGSGVVDVVPVFYPLKVVLVVIGFV